MGKQVEGQYHKHQSLEASKLQKVAVLFDLTYQGLIPSGMCLIYQISLTSKQGADMASLTSMIRLIHQRTSVSVQTCLAKQA
jgi:hypothetical protein